MNVVLMWLFVLSDIIVLATLTAVDIERKMCVVNVTQLSYHQLLNHRYMMSLVLSSAQLFIWGVNLLWLSATLVGNKYWN